MNIARIRLAIQASREQAQKNLNAMWTWVKPRAVGIRGTADRFLRRLGLQLNTLMRFIIPLGLSMVVALMLASSKGASFTGGTEAQILPDQKDLVLKRLDFLASEGQMYLAVVLSMAGAGLTKAYTLLSRKGASTLQWLGVMAVGTGFFFGLLEWGFLQGTLHAVLKTNHFGDSFFLKLMANLQKAMAWTGIGTLVLLAIPSRDGEKSA